MILIVTRRVGILWIAMAVIAGSLQAAPIFFGPTPYLSFNNSPFQGMSFSSFYLEDFEDGALNTPGVTLTVVGADGFGVTSPGTFTDSVDADDGTIDGSGQGGHSLGFGAFNTPPSPSSATFSFDAGVLGAFPTHVGIVWTDVGRSTNPTYGFGNVTFEAFGPTGISLGSIGPFPVGDGASSGMTAEDRFFGVADPNGISKITIGMNSHDWEIDHLQYGVPEPRISFLLGFGFCLLLNYYRRRYTRVR